MTEPTDLVFPVEALAGCPRAAVSHYQAGEVILAAQSICDGFFYLHSGKAKVSLHWQNESVCVLEMMPGEAIGLPCWGAGELSFFQVVSDAECQVQKYRWEAFPRNDSAFAALTRYCESRMHYVRTCQKLIASFHRAYQQVSASFLEDIIREGQFLTLMEGEKLFEQGDSAQVMYFLLSGKIDVYVGAKEKITRVGQIFQGEPFGEMSLFTGESRSATLVAARPCQLLSLNRRNFDRLTQQYPQLSTYIVNSLITRIKKQNERIRQKYQPVNRLLLFSSEPRFRENEEAITQLLQYEKENLITEGQVAQALGCEPGDTFPHSRVSDYLDGVEQQSQRNFFRARLDQVEWVKLCLERSDEVWLVLDELSDRRRVIALLEPFKSSFAWNKQRRVLVLAHPGNGVIRNTHSWLDLIQPDQHLHFSPGSLKSEKRLIRFLTDASVGLVLGGGGARGFAQAGVLRAFEEAGIPVDWVGGTSIGSILGGWLAKGWSSEEIVEAIRRFFVKVNPLGDYTLPMISLSRSQRLDNLLQQGLGHELIEDLPTTFFCVSSDMSLAEEYHHEAGVLWRAVRASISIPGIIAPVIDQGHYLVDGGLLNNLPCDLMRDRNRGPVIAVDVSPHEAFLTQLRRIPSPWRLLKNKLFGIPQPGVPMILETILRSSLLASVKRQKTNRALVDLYIQPEVNGIGMLEFKKMDKIVEAGYLSGLEMLSRWQSQA